MKLKSGDLVKCNTKHKVLMFCSCKNWENFLVDEWDFLSKFALVLNIKKQVVQIFTNGKFFWIDNFHIVELLK